MFEVRWCQCPQVTAFFQTGFTDLDLTPIQLTYYMSCQFWLWYLANSITHQIENYPPGLSFFNPDNDELLSQNPDTYERWEIEARWNSRTVRHKFTPAVSKVINNDDTFKGPDGKARCHNTEDCEWAGTVKFFNRWSWYGHDSLCDYASLLERLNLNLRNHWLQLLLF